MSILDRFKIFKDTIIIKENSNLELQLRELQELAKEDPTNENLNKEIISIQQGIKGEENILFELKNTNIGMYVLQDITLSYENQKAQIDFIIITKGFTYLVECKNLYGNITITENGHFIKEYNYNNKNIKEAIYSPYTQAQRHKDILKKRWMDNHKISSIIRNKVFDDLWYKPIVVLANPKSILTDENAPKEIKNNVIKIDQLVAYIKEDIDNYNKDLYSNKKYMETLANEFLIANTNEHSSIADKYKNNLLDTLKTFRKEKSKEHNIPAYYIFNDKELDLILENKPKTLEELNKILPEIKVKLHGEQIINIIKRY